MLIGWRTRYATNGCTAVINILEKPLSDERFAVASGQFLNEAAVPLNEHIKKNRYLC